MITVVSSKIETKILLSETSPTYLIVENPREYFSVVENVINAFQSEESCFSFWDNEKQVLPSQVGEVLVNFFDFEFSDKKIINLLYKRLTQNYFESKLILDFNLLNSKLESFLLDLGQTVDFLLDYKELSLEDLLKASSVKPAVNYQNLLEKIICYINLFVSLKNVKFFVFIGLKQVLSDDDLVQLYKHCEFNQVSLLSIESAKRRDRLPNERIILITDDLCEIVENIKE